MSEPQNISRLLPRWDSTIGAIANSNALLRSCCSKCETELREDPHALAALHGGQFLIDGYRVRCRKVACDGLLAFKVSRTYGRQWIALDGPALQSPSRYAVLR